MTSVPLIEAALLVLLGGFGWLLGRLPDRFVYAVMATAVLLGIVALTQGR